MVSYGKQDRNKDGRKGTCIKCINDTVMDKAKVKKKELKSGGCVVCGYNKCPSALEFHHVTYDKVRNISEINSEYLVKQEAKKCIVVCANCHREIHAGMVKEYPYKKLEEVHIIQEDDGQMKIWI
jgi:hypothetical protein